MLSNTEGLDFGPYLAPVYRAVKAKWFAVMPPSVLLGKQGRNAVEFRILRDGNVPEDTLKMVFSSGSETLDAASRKAILKAVPFDHLPEKYSQPFIVLRFTFYYNLPLPKPH